ncbi:MAG: IS1595 family transposase [Hyphomicrobium sp.]|uniref:IS1595 family transposase n=1 Tax=Hyphomicrobium sp. TaxID=82 RepID=UPI0035656502
MSTLTQKHYHDEKAAYRFVESRIWPNGPVCPHCGEAKRISAMKGESTRIGAYKCYGCRKPFTVKIGTIFEASKVPMHQWLQAIFLMCSSKKGISSNQLHRMLGVQLRTAWFMSHRIREAMRTGSLAAIGGPEAVVEVDETFIGNKKGGRKPKGGFAHKHAVLSLVERGGEVRSFHIDRATAAEVTPIVNANVAREAKIMTDDGRHYIHQFRAFDGHETVRHSLGEYVIGDIHTNTVEGYFSIFKRGMKGVYQHCSEKHLHRYLAEFDFRYNNRIAVGVNDELRTEQALQGIKGKRLKYRDSLAPADRT